MRRDHRELLKWALLPATEAAWVALYVMAILAEELAYGIERIADWVEKEVEYEKEDPRA